MFNHFSMLCIKVLHNHCYAWWICVIAVRRYFTRKMLRKFHKVHTKTLLVEYLFVTKLLSLFWYFFISHMGLESLLGRLNQQSSQGIRGFLFYA